MVHFLHPEALWLLLLLPLLWLSVAALPARLSRLRRRISIVLRSLLALALILAVAGIQTRWSSGATTTVFLIDGSDSVAASQRARAEAYVAEALAAMPPDDQAALVVFGERALVERSPSSARTLGQIVGRPPGGATNLNDALQLGLAILPAEARQRLVLISDGGQNSGDVELALREATSRGVPIDVVVLRDVSDGPDAQIGLVELPAAAREGQRLPLAVEVIGTAPAAGRLLVIDQNGTTVGEQPIDLIAGTQRFQLTLPEPPGGFNRYRIRVEVEGDPQARNNVAEAYTLVSGRPRILIIEGFPDEGAPLAQALRAAQLDVDLVAPAAAPPGIAELSTYDALALVNVPRQALAETTIAAMRTFVHDLGHGLLMVGGPQSFGPGGWRDTPVETALPVSMDIPNRLRLPPVSVVVVIDISGSMAQTESGRSKLSLALEGAQRVASLLRDEDQLTVIPFDHEARYVVGPLPGSRRDEAIEALSRVRIGGGGINIRDALTYAAREIRRSDRPIRHIITLTDGDDTTQQSGALAIVEQLEAEGVTLSSIAIGDGSHVPFIRDMAQVGQGRSFLTDSAGNLPTILVTEAQSVMQPYIIEGQITPQIGVSHPILRDMSRAPAVAGLVATTPRQTAQVLLAAPDGTALLVAWQHGLGRAVVWTSDFSGRWGREWITDEAFFPQFSTQIVNWLLPVESAQSIALQTSVVGGEVLLTAQVIDEHGAAREGLRLNATLVTSAGAAGELALREVLPGEYRTTVGGYPPGAYLLQLIATAPDATPAGSLTAGLVVPFGAEYRSGGADPALLAAIAAATGGRVDPTPASAFDQGAAGRGAAYDLALPLL
ncbi:MAG TPA: VWA domain-containing protein, partial [Roseiflexaceae bacterium]|nr:VWA domain-containing protein [Roseiflexaceae bacterium]